MWGGRERYSSIDNEQWERVVKWQLSSMRLNYYYYCFYCYCYHLSAPFNVNRRIVRINITSVGRWDVIVSRRITRRFDYEVREEFTKWKISRSFFFKLCQPIFIRFFQIDFSFPSINSQSRVNHPKLRRRNPLLD